MTTLSKPNLFIICNSGDALIQEIPKSLRYLNTQMHVYVACYMQAVRLLTAKSMNVIIISDSFGANTINIIHLLNNKGALSRTLLCSASEHKWLSVVNRFKDLSIIDMTDIEVLDNLPVVIRNILLRQ